MSTNDAGAGTVLAAFIIGAVAGAAAALLLAPAAGDETREYLAQRAREGRERAAEAARQGRDLFNQQRDNLTSAVDRARQEFQGAAGTGDRDA